MRGVTKPGALHVIVRDFDDALRTQRLPTQVLAAIPPAGTTGHALSFHRFRPVAPWMFLQSILAQRRELFDQLFAHHIGKGCCNTDMMQRAFVVVEAEEQGADHGASAVLVPPEAGNYAVSGALVLHLDHGSLAGSVRLIETFCHDAVQSRPLKASEPILSELAIARGRRKMDRRSGFGERVFEPRTTLLERRLTQVFVSDGEKIPRHERCRRLLGEHLHARCRRMDAQKHGLEVETLRAGNHDLTVDDTSLWQRGRKRRDELRKVSVHRFLVPALQKDVVAVAKYERSESIPLRLEEPTFSRWQRSGGGGQHRRERWIEWQLHRRELT